VVVSPHKFVGGPQTPGVLVVRREMVGNQVASTPGGGTIAIPAGLVVSLREAVGTPVIAEREQGWWQHALDAWRRPRESAGHRLLEDYRFDATSGVWRHRELPEPAPPSFADRCRCISTRRASCSLPGPTHARRPERPATGRCCGTSTSRRSA